MVKDYQDYKKADKLAMLESNLKEVQEISHKIMGDVRQFIHILDII